MHEKVPSGPMDPVVTCLTLTTRIGGAANEKDTGHYPHNKK